MITLLGDIARHGVQTWWAPALAFAAGAVSCASPCILPLMPGYLAFVSGSEGPAGNKGREMVPVLLFIAGFTVVFTVLFGFTASSVSTFLRQTAGQRLAGAFVFSFGLFMLMYAFRVKMPWLYREARPLLSKVSPGKAAAFPLGMAFAVGWTPCIGPVLGAILTLAAAQGGTARAVLLLLFYSLGLGVPIFLLGLGMRWAMKASRFISRNYHWFAGAGGALMMAIGVLLVTGAWVRLLSPVLRLVNRFTPAI